MREIEQKIINKIDEISGELIEEIRNLVRIKSVKSEPADDAPYGQGVRRALDEALRLSRRLGFSTSNLDHHIGYASYGEGEDYVCAIGHVDVVPEGDGWKQPPFSGYRDEEFLYGRGVLDNKGPILSCLYGLYALKELNINPKRAVRVIFGCDEESGFADLEYYLSHEKPPVYGFTPDCKYPVVYAERGRTMFEIKAPIKELPAFFEILNAYFISANSSGDRLGIDYSNLEYGMMEMRNYKLNVDDDHAYFEFALSYPLGITIRQIEDRIKEKIPAAWITLKKNYDPVVFDKEGPLVKTLQTCYEDVTGADGTPVTTTGGTYAKGMPNIVPFGPSFPGQKGIGHNPNEWMKVEDIITNAKIYALSLYHLSQL